MAVAIGIVGGGLMGAGIATKFALAGFPTMTIETDRERLANVKHVAAEVLSELIAAEQITDAQRQSALEHMQVSAELESLSHVRIVIEAIPEVLTAKHELYDTLEQIVEFDALIASNTSGFPPDLLSEKMQWRRRFLIAHFWNPPHQIPLVEVVPGTDTDPAVVTEIVDRLTEIRAEPVVLNAAIPGFIGNRLQFAVLREALHIVQMGVANPETVDAVMKASLGRRYSIVGPFEGADLGGLETFLKIASHLMPELASDQRSLEVLREHVDKGEVGIRSGKGFYEWNEARIARIKRLRREQLRSRRTD